MFAQASVTTDDPLAITDLKAWQLKEPRLAAGTLLYA